MRDNPIDFEREAIRAQKKFKKTKDTGVTTVDIGTFRKSRNKQKRLKDMFSKKSFEEVDQSICKWMVANRISWNSSKGDFF